MRSSAPDELARNSDGRSRSGSGAPAATLNHDRVLVIECTARTAIEFVSSPAGRQFNAFDSAPSIDVRMSLTAVSRMCRAATRMGSGMNRESWTKSEELRPDSEQLRAQ